MKISAWHKAHGDTVEWWWGFGRYDRVYMTKVFDETYSPNITEPCNAQEIVKGGTGYVKRKRDKTLWIYRNSTWTEVHAETDMHRGEIIYQEILPDNIEHMYPDYSLYPELTNDIAYGFLTRGCPRHCGFCIVGDKEGLCSHKVADLPEFWNRQKNIKLLDPNILAYRDHLELLRKLIKSNAYVDFTQGLDIRFVNEQNIELLNQIRIKEIHFAWDNPRENLEPMFKAYAKHAKHKPHGEYGTVYCLTNFNTTIEEDLYRVYTLRDLGYNPYIMIYDKPSAPREIRLLQRWVNNKIIFKSCRRFEDYDEKIG